MIYEEICTYEVCKLAKKKGFNEECRDFYCDDKLQKRITRTSCNRQVTSFDYCSNSMLEDYDSPKEYYNIAAPTQSLLQRWLREEKNLYISIIAHAKSKRVYYEWEVRYISALGNMNKASSVMAIETYRYNTYELALEDALDYSLKNLV